MLYIGNSHIFSAKQGCLITDPARKVAGIRALLTPWGHVICDGYRLHFRSEVVFSLSMQWALGALVDPRRVRMGEDASRAVTRFAGVDVETMFGWEGGYPPTRIRVAVDNFRSNGM